MSNKVDNKIKETYLQAYYTNDMKLKIRFTKKIFPDFSFFKFKNQKLYQHFDNDEDLTIDVSNPNILGIRNKSTEPVKITFKPN